MKGAAMMSAQLGAARNRGSGAPGAQPAKPRDGPRASANIGDPKSFSQQQEAKKDLN